MSTAASGEPISSEVAHRLDACPCTWPLWAEQEEGPYRRGEQPHRRDVTEGRDGVPLALGLRLRDAGGEPVDRAEVEIWHCDALGRYSGYPPPDPSLVVTAATAPRAEYLPGETFLRGRQRTDPAGRVEFRTIHPGWYPGRTVHVHAMVHVGDRSFTSQLYFPEDIVYEVLAEPPYRDRGMPDTTNETDEIFPTGGRPTILEIMRDDGGLVGGLCLVLPGEQVTT